MNRVELLLASTILVSRDRIQGVPCEAPDGLRAARHAAPFARSLIADAGTNAEATSTPACVTFHVRPPGSWWRSSRPRLTREARARLKRPVREFLTVEQLLRICPRSGFTQCITLDLSASPMPSGISNDRGEDPALLCAQPSGHVSQTHHVDFAPKLSTNRRA